ncbi:unnamed protein product [Dibothriocephalus latus]|uniref:Uncharacterized protein n=1 Tax=Dibothriocephalus latus TaxID=60516 RepID=A0A3P7LQT9_DIBLA|nr:unnamed protein product [Dibothriocephalus latus]
MLAYALCATPTLAGCRLLPIHSSRTEEFTKLLGRKLLQTRMAEHVAAVTKKDANFPVAAHSTGPGHSFLLSETEIVAGGDNPVSRELLESWFSGP